MVALGSCGETKTRTKAPTKGQTCSAITDICELDHSEEPLVISLKVPLIGPAVKYMLYFCDADCVDNMKKATAERNLIDIPRLGFDLQCTPAAAPAACNDPGDPSLHVAPFDKKSKEISLVLTHDVYQYPFAGNGSGEIIAVAVTGDVDLNDRVDEGIHKGLHPAAGTAVLGKPVVRVIE